MKKVKKKRNKMRAAIAAIAILILFAGCIQNCDSLPKEYGQRDMCWRQAAINSKNETICQKIEDQHLRDFWCYRHIAYLKKDFKICEKIDNDSARSSCIKILNGEEKFETGLRQ
jgi:hypothetical protein